MANFIFLHIGEKINYTYLITRPYLWFLFLLVILSSCHKSSGPTYYYIDNNLKEWCFFNSGSYWVYLNENTNKPDSVFIKRNPSCAFMPPDDPLFREQTCGYSVLNGFFTEIDLVGGRDYSYMSFAGISTVYYTSPSPLDTYIIETGTALPGSDTTLHVFGKIDTLILNNNKFINVIHTRNIGNYHGVYHYDYYFAKNIGLIKFSVSTAQYDTTWSLMRWHTNQ